MIIKKKKGTFNDYDVQLSWGQLNAVYHALEQDHADPLADELFAELGWYLQNVPGPGEDEDEYKQAKEAEKMATEGGEGGGGPDEEYLGQEVKEPSAEGGDLEGAESPAPPQEGGGGEESEADALLERPPGHEPAMAQGESARSKFRSVQL